MSEATRATLTPGRLMPALPATGAELVMLWRERFPHELAEVPVSVFRALEVLCDAVILEARDLGNVPRRPIPEDAKRGGKLPRR